MRPMISGLTVLLAFVPLAAVAETVYVTDNLRLGLYEAPDTSGRPFRMLESGQAMDVMSRDRNYANVRMPDATEGWVKAAYLVDDKPARLIVAELTAERDSLVAELAETRESFAAPAETIAALRNDAEQFDAQLVDAHARVEELEDENSGLEGLAEQYKGSLPLSWVAAAMIVCLIAGLLLGMWWVDRQSRMRHGGIRIY